MRLPALDVAPDRHLGALLDEVEALAERLATLVAEGTAPARDASLDAAAVATLRLDGSPIEAPVRLPEGSVPIDGTATGPARGGWLETLRSGAIGLDDAPDEVLMALEHRGARAGLDADHLAVTLRSDLPAALAALHRITTEGLLHPDVAGRARRSEQSVHDASIGRVLFFPVDPERIPERSAHLAAWLADTDAHPLVASGVLQHQLLEIHPYEAANGRLARTAARLLLRRADLDPGAAAQPEATLLADPIGYLDEVARARRLGSPMTFVSRWAEAVAAGLRAVLPALPADDVPGATRRFLAGAPVAFTLGDHRDAAGGRDGDAGLVHALDAGLVRRVVGTLGLRYRRTGGTEG